MSTPDSVAEWQTRRQRLLDRLTAIDDLCPGTLVRRYPKCGKPTCLCAKPDDPGYGPAWTLVFRVRTRTG